MYQEQLIEEFKKKLESELKNAELLTNDIQASKEKKIKENTERSQLLRTLIEKHTADLVKQVYVQRDQIKEELKSTESNLKKKLNEDVLKEKQLTEKQINDAKKYLSKKELNNRDALSQRLTALNAQNKALKQKIQELSEPNKNEYMFQPNESLDISSNFNGTIEEIRKNDSLIEKVDTTGFSSKSKRNCLPYLQDLANRYFLKGQEFKSNNWNEAIKCFSQATKIDPNFYEPIESKAFHLIEAHEAEQALKYFERLIEIDDKLISGYIGKAMCFVAFEKFNEALEYYDKALEIDSNSYVALLNKARVLCQMKIYDTSIKTFDKAIQLNETSECYSGKGLVYFFLENYSEAIINFEKAIQLNPNDVSQSNHYATACFNTGNYKECVRVINQSIKYIKLTEVKRDLLFLKGQCLFKLKKYDEAIETLELTVFISKNNSATDEFSDPLYEQIYCKLLVLIENCKTHGGVSKGYDKEKLDREAQEINIKLAKQHEDIINLFSKCEL